jgi:diguanylate cyclase (GGDEF)-like protein
LKVTQALQDFRQLSRMYGLLVLDLDHFKKINDAHGHGVGDAVLKMVADTLAPGLRAGDLIGRWGGEEFVVLLPEVRATVLGDMAERCRLMIAQSSVANGPTRVSTTASIGATFLNDNDSMESVIQRADALMYESKRSGRDRTTVG